MLLYVITSRKLLSGDDSAQRETLVELARGWARGGVHTIQVREKDLPLTDLQRLAQQIVAAVRTEAGPTGRPAGTRVLVNGPPQVAIDSGADAGE